MHITPRSTRIPRVLALTVLTLLAANACGGSSASTYTTNPGNGSGGNTAGGNTTSLNLQGTAFSPQFDTVAVGSTVTWTNKDAATHTVTSDAGTFDSGDLMGGQTFSRTFNAAGAYPYHCKYHGSAGFGMYGVIVVK